MDIYYDRYTGNHTSTRCRNDEVQDRIKRRKAQKKVAKERHPGRKFEYRNGILYFAGTTERVSGSFMIQKPKMVG
jgi:hypothetical protein